ncbi:MAG: hypothetical protein K2Y39_23225 [Candidatus Obscuribacterales bacterium]|nr:hypothetical protein [Candidatus Obscuribacterales bacterium]
MRVELIYRPGCNSYTSVRDTLEKVIAEERLPIPVELVEGGNQNAPRIRINGNEEHDSGITNTLEALTDLLSKKWKELTECPLAL